MSGRTLIALLVATHALPAAGADGAVPGEVVIVPVAPEVQAPVAAPVAETQPTVVIAAPSTSVTVVCPPTQIVVMPPAPRPPEPLAPLPVERTAVELAVATTRLEFVAAGDEAEVISRWNEDEDVWDYEVVCVTPCAIDVPNGMHEFMAGDHRTFQVYALGGVQRWRVEDNNQAGIVAGAIMTGLGGLVPFLAWSINGFEDPLADVPDSYGGDEYDSYGFGRGSSAEDDANALYAVTGIGAGTFALGLLIWILSYGSAEQETVGDGYVPVGQGLGVQPSVFMAEDGLGGRLWGVGLGLRY